jgi:peroxiredoxin
MTRQSAFQDLVSLSKEMTMTEKLKSGQRLPKVTVARLGGGHLQLGQPLDDHDWQMVVVYRGKHCPICKTYLAELERTAPEFAKAGVGVIAISSDPEDRARTFTAEIGVTFPVGYGLTVEQMQGLGLYVSEPRSAKETDRPFAEPGVFVINADGLLQVLDISNAPFARPDLAGLAKGLKFIRDNDYPIRGQLAA